MRGQKISYSVADAEKVQSMAQYGLTQDQIADVMGIAKNTLRKLYLKELTTGANLACMAVGKRLFEKCMDGDTTALIYWTKARMGWKDKTSLEISGAEDIETTLLEARERVRKLRKREQ